MVVDLLAHPGIESADLSSLQSIGGGGAALEVVVTFQNAPAGMRVNTSSAPGITADVRIDRSMPSFGGGP